jgi:TusA-related sulfurtransferase
LTEVSEPSKTLDTVGLFCPEPLFRTREYIEQIEIDEILEVWADDPASEADLQAFAKRAGHEMVLIEKDDDQFRFLIRRKK